MLRNRYVFQESKPYQTTVLDTHRPKREVTAENESGARSRLPKPGYGRVWKLIETIKVNNIPKRLVPVYMGDDRSQVIGSAEILANGIVDILLEDGIRLQSNPIKFDSVMGVSLGFSVDHSI